MSKLAKADDTGHLMEQYAGIYTLLAEKNEDVADSNGQDHRTGSFTASNQAGAQDAKNELNITAFQNPLPVSQDSSTVTAVSLQEPPASSTTRAFNHAAPSDSSQVEPGPCSSTPRINDMTHPAPLREDQNPVNNDQIMRHDSENGINYQTLLDNLSQPASTIPPINDATITVPNSAADSNTRLLDTEPSSFAPSNLPARPPPQDNRAINPTYSPADGIRSFHNSHTQNTADSSHSSQSNTHGSASLNASDTSAPSSTYTGLPSVLASLHQPNSPNFQYNTKTGAEAHNSRSDEAPGSREPKPHDDRNNEAPWGPEIQRKYDEFLHNERIYVTEGVWDRFAPGSRLFVGNLPSERVTKRDLFHLFHKYGKLAQISIKPAYGFVQFMDATSCRNALEAEQNGTIRGRKIHLEISKPQRSGRNANEPSKQGRSKRSRSPDIGKSREVGRGARSGSERHDRNLNGKRSPIVDRRDHPDRHRDTYRPPVRGGRDDYRSRDQSPERYDVRSRRRSRSPYGPNDRHRNTPPMGHGYDSDSELPIPRRAPRHVPDVQILVLEDLDNAFVHHIETAFKDRGLQTDVLILSPRIGLQAVIRRQILEGVLAVVKLSKSNQYSCKIPLQVFDRGRGADNVRFNGRAQLNNPQPPKLTSVEYSGLEPKVAVEVVLHARNVPISASSQTLPTSGLGVQVPVPPQNLLGPQPNVANLISNLDAPALQSLLGALQQNTAGIAQPQYRPSGQPPGNLANLSHITHHNNPGPSMLPPSQYPAHAQPFGQPAANTPLEAETNLAALLAKGQVPPTDPSQARFLMEQLAKWKQ
ncbi:predicted protein [Uncinocarpus reesii 1704]|uniref:RRM domain-containing protein n=1 Tax=Uncinocarpus reesii (strain UAMH 1704) TaxID=336963 RepID=C4JWC9_UNCRE|nr:uncharacterized protein UREG_06871 [Uncinocarpus reesii 1704]EEP82006.1 predicted protein [Uncinocarpus reesii 1704]